MARQLRCRTCREPILLIGRPGFIKRGEPKYFAVNPDDRQPHGKRCRLTMELREARRSKSPFKPKHSGDSQGAARGGAPMPPTQKELPL